jgi:hypothetical protein
MSKDVHARGTVLYMVQERRPRIPAELADKIDQLRQGEIPFERYIHNVLERHVGFYLRDETTPHRKPIAADHIHHYEDGRGGQLEVGLPLQSERNEYDALAILWMHDEEWDNPASALLPEAELRALRDLCTELLGELA